MFGDKILQAARQMMLARQFEPIGDMTNNSLSTILWFQIIVRVNLTGRLVFHKKERVGSLAHIVE